MGLRLGVHFGPIFPVDDPVLGRRGFMGSHVSRTARLEPVTPEGSVYVTEPFAAAICVEAAGAYVWVFAGRMPAGRQELRDHARVHSPGNGEAIGGEL